MDIYLMPDMGLNLFSIGTAEMKGITVKMERGTIRLKDKTERMLGHAYRAGKLYYIQASTTRHTLEDPAHLCNACMKAETAFYPASTTCQRGGQACAHWRRRSSHAEGLQQILMVCGLHGWTTRWWYVCNMKIKGQAQHEIMWFIDMVYTQMDRTIKRLIKENPTGE